MRKRSLLAFLVAALPAVSATAQCTQVCRSANWNATHLGRQLTAATFAIQVPGLPQADTICRVELYCHTRNAAPVALPISIYDSAANGAPGQLVGAGTMFVGTTLGTYAAQLQAPVPARTDFHIVFDNAIGNLAPPTALGGSTVPHHVGSAGVWSGPFSSVQWMYQAYCSSRVARASFDRSGTGCRGTHGTPRIDAVGTPVLGSLMQVLLAQAPARAPVVYAMGLTAGPLDLGSLGAPGCALEQVPLVTVARTAGSTGAASVAHRIPNDRALLGAAFRVQWIVVDPLANSLGISVSPGGIAWIGDH